MIFSRSIKLPIGIASCLFTLTAAGQEAASLPQRNVLVEVFSTERCNNCPTGHQTLDYALGDKSNVIELVHHAGFFTDKFTIPESTAYEWFYKSLDYSSSFAPAFMMDRTHWDALPDYYYYSAPMSMSFSSKALKAAYAEAAAMPALAHISIVSSYNADERLLSLDIKAEALVATDGYEHPTLNVFLTENGVESKTQEGSFGNYVHNHLVRQCLTTTWGEDFEAGGTISRHYEATLPEDWRPENMTVVAFVANYNSRSNADCRVMNAEEVQLLGTPDAPDGLVSARLSHNAAPRYNLQGQHITGQPRQSGIYVNSGRLEMIK